MRAVIIPPSIVQNQYKKSLNILIGAMVKDIEETFKLPKVAQDEKPKTLAQAMKELRNKWYKKFERAGRELARWGTKNTNEKTSKIIEAKLKEIGFSFNPNYSNEQKALISRIIDENVSYIKSIPQRFIKRLQTNLTAKYGYRPLAEIIDEAIVKGGDRNYIKRQIDKLAVISQEHASNIARDQTNKATQTLAVFNAKAMGATQGRWIHIQGKYSSRLTHIMMNGKVFNLDKGLYDTDVGKYIMPAELPYCQCQFEVLLPEFEGKNENNI